VAAEPAAGASTAGVTGRDGLSSGLVTVGWLRLLMAVFAGWGALACSASPPEGSRTGGVADAGDEATPQAEPRLTELTVSWRDPETSPRLQLTPAFSPGVFDYYVRCRKGDNALTVSMTASAGAASALLEPTASSPSPRQTLHVSAREDAAIVATASVDGTTIEYWVRCLPDDFPSLSMTAYPKADSAPPGYYLLGNATLTDERWGYAMLLTQRGVPIWYAHGWPGEAVADVDQLSPETITFFLEFGHPVEVRRLSPFETTYVAPSGTSLDSHELRVLPNGNYLVISAPIATGVDLTGVKVPLTDGGTATFGPNSSTIDCNLVEFDPKTGEVAWTWVGRDHLDAAAVTTAPMLSPKLGPDGGLIAEPFHCNSIDVDPSNGNLLVSARDMDAIFYIERATGKILWKIGGTMPTKDHATYVPMDDRFYRQHDARLQPGWSARCAGGSGQISLFDNHSDVDGPARALVLDVVVGGSDGGTVEDCGTGRHGVPGASVAWQVAGPTNSGDMGSFRISRDGSRVIGWGRNGIGGLAFTEVDVDGEPLLELHFTGHEWSYRAVKVPLSAFDVGVLRRTAGRP
jgi:hypothetical protein